MSKNNNPETPEPKKPVVARGKAIQRTDAELDEMTSAEAMQKLAEGAAEDWELNAPRKFKKLLGKVKN